jgi:type IV pilus assembly protein PilW
MRRVARGFSLIELMVGVVLAIVVLVIIMQSLAVFESQKRATTGGADSAVNGSIAMFQVERDARMAAFGLTSPAGMLCPLGINIYYNPTVVSNGAVLAPILITDGASGGVDQIRLARSNSTSGIAPSILVAAMAGPTSTVVTASTLGIASGDHFVVGAADGTKVCTLMQATAAPTTAGTGWNLVHASTSSYNPAAPATAFTTAPAYVVGDQVVALGAFGLWNYRVMCNDNAAPSDANSCDLVQYDTISTTGTINWANAAINHVASQVIDLQAQYGVAPAGTDAVSQWVDATGAWVAPISNANMLRIKAIRVALVARSSKYENTMVSPASLVLWDAGQASEKARALTDAQRHYRYKVFYLVIPAINMVWANV